MELVLRDLVVLADIGVNPDEIGRPQTLVIDVSLSLCRVTADEIGATIDYREIVQEAESLGTRRIALIETFAMSLAQALIRDPRARKTTVTVTKPKALHSGVASARFTLERPLRSNGSSPRGEQDRSNAALLA